MALQFKPVMTTLAGSSYALLKQGFGPLGDPLVAILRFLLMPRTRRPSSVNTSDTNDASEAVITAVHSQGGGWEAILVYVLTGLIGLAVLLAVVWLTLMLIRWLLSRKQWESSTGKYPNLTLHAFLLLVLARLKAFSKWVQRLFVRTRTARQVYDRLVTWGRRSGINKKKDETPREFTERLSRTIFPRFRNISGSSDRLLNLNTTAAGKQISKVSMRLRRH